MAPSSVQGADRPAAVLSYVRGSGAEHCPDEQAIRDSVAARLGYDPFRTAASRQVHASILRSEKGFSGLVELREQDGTLLGKRALESDSEDCGELAHAVALAITISIDPLVAVRPEKAQGSAGSTSSSGSSPQPNEQDVGSSPRTGREPLPSAAHLPLPPTHLTTSAAQPAQLRASIGPLVVLRGAPSVAGGVQAGVSVHVRAFSLALEGLATLPASTQAPDRISPVDFAPKGEVSASLLAGSVVPCARFEDWSGCLVLSVGALRGNGKRLDVEQQQSTPYGAVGIRVGYEPHVAGSLYGYLQAEVSTPVTKTVLHVDGREAWTTPTIGSALGAGLAWRFK